MEYKGIFVRDYFQLQEDYIGTLYTYLNDSCEVIILFDKNSPKYRIIQIGILLEELPNYTDSRFSIWDCNIICEDDNECKLVAKSFAKEISTFLKDALKYFSGKKTYRT